MLKARRAKMTEAVLRAIGTTEYRSMQNSLERAVYLVQMHGIAQAFAGKEESVSRDAVKRALKAARANRQLGVGGRPRLLSSAEEVEVKATIEKRSSGLNSLNVVDFIHEVRCP